MNHATSLSPEGEVRRGFRTSAPPVTTPPVAARSAHIRQSDRQRKKDEEIRRDHQNWWCRPHPASLILLFVPTTPTQPPALFTGANRCRPGRQNRLCATVLSPMLARTFPSRAPEFGGKPGHGSAEVGLDPVEAAPSTTLPATPSCQLLCPGVSTQSDACPAQNALGVPAGCPTGSRPRAGRLRQPPTSALSARDGHLGPSRTTGASLPADTRPSLSPPTAGRPVKWLRGTAAQKRGSEPNPRNDPWRRKS